MTCFGSDCNLFSVKGENTKLTSLTWFQDGYWREKLKLDHVFIITQRQRNYSYFSMQDFALTKCLSFVKIPWDSSIPLKVKLFPEGTYSAWSDPTSQSNRYHFCFVFGRFRVQISVGKQTILLEVFRCFPQFLQTNSAMVPLSTHSIPPYIKWGINNFVKWIINK
jgi:hypothetical protein